MSHVASIRALVLAVGVMLGDLTALGPAQAGSLPSIFSLEVQPAGEISPTDQIGLVLEIVTPSRPAFLFLPTEVEIIDGEITVDVFITSGALTVPGVLIETVTLGTFGPGTYQFTIGLHDSFGLPKEEFTGSFTVVPEPNSLALLVTSLAALLLCPGARRTL